MASDDKCGSIGLTQREQHVVININCNVDPGVMIEVCRELRVGYRSVANEMLRNKTEIGAKLEEMENKLTAKLEENNAKLEEMASLHREEITALKDLVRAGAGDRKRKRDENMQLENPICKKRHCMKPLTERFAKGDLKKQCSSCRSFNSSARK